MKVAFTTKTGEMIDLHFGQAEKFQIWEIGPDSADHLETVSVGSMAAMRRTGFPPGATA